MKFKIESSEKDYTYNYFVYYKTGLFGKWKLLGGKLGIKSTNELGSDIYVVLNK